MLWKYKKCYQETNEDVVFSCTKYTLTVEQSDIDASDDGTVYMEYNDCETQEVIIRQHTLAGTYQRCIFSGIPIVYIYVDTVLTTVVDSTIVSSGGC